MKKYPTKSNEDKKKEIDDILKQLEDGIKNIWESESFKNYLLTMAKFPNYSINNQLLIMWQNPDATMCQSFTGWKKMGRFVKQGEKGLKILAPIKVKKDIVKTDMNGQPELDTNGNEIIETKVAAVRFKVAYTFDIEQTDGKEIPALGIKQLLDDVDDFNEIFDTLNEICPVPITLEDISGGVNGYYSLSDNRIVVKKGMGEAQTIKTTIHEMAHQMLHNKEALSENKITRSEMEVEAESVAFVVCNHFGIDSSDYSFYYVTSWSSGKDTKELKASLQKIKDAASEIIGKIEKKFYPEVSIDEIETEDLQEKQSKDEETAIDESIVTINNINKEKEDGMMDGLIGLYTSKGYEFKGIEKLNEKAIERLEKALHKYEVLGYSEEAVHYLSIAETRFYFYPVIKANLNPGMAIDDIKRRVIEAAGVIDVRLLLESDYNILDTETTGFAETDEVIELAITNNYDEVEFNQMFRPDVEVSESASAVNGISNDDLKNMPRIADRVEELVDVITSKPLLIYNKSFDAKMILQTFDLHKHDIPDYGAYRHRLQEHFDKNTYCIMNTYTERKDEVKATNLVEALKEQGVEVVQKHRAVNDCFDTNSLIKAIIKNDLEKTFSIENIFGEKVDVRLDVARYYNNNLYIDMIIHDEDGYGEPYGALTVNFPDVEIPMYCAYVDVNNIPNAEQFIVDNKLGTFTHMVHNSGYISYPLYQFDKDVLKSLCPDGTKAYEESFQEQQTKGMVK